MRSGWRAIPTSTRRSSVWHSYATTSVSSGDSSTHWSLSHSCHICSTGLRRFWMRSSRWVTMTRIGADAPAWLIPGTYVEPFALRALGIAREDAQQLEEAATRFAAMDLDWHASETRKLLG